MWRFSRKEMASDRPITGIGIYISLCVYFSAKAIKTKNPNQEPQR